MMKAVSMDRLEIVVKALASLLFTMPSPHFSCNPKFLYPVPLRDKKGIGVAFDFFARFGLFCIWTVHPPFAMKNRS